jgi:hypothetical protein
MASKEKQKWSIIEIDTDYLEEENLHPDEDFLEQAIKNVGPKTDIVKRTRWFRDNVEKFSHLFDESVQSLGTCSHKGIIPPEAITRVSVFNPPQYLKFMAIDPMITLLNYQICSHKYISLTKWMIGDNIEAEDLDTFKGFTLRSDEETKRLNDILSDRSNWSRIK